MIGQKHLVACRCVLPQFKKRQNPPQHQFVVFSVIDDNNNVKVKYAQCPNCRIVHRVIELSKSEVVSGREAMQSITGIDDIKNSLPERIANVLDLNNADLPTWEAVQFILKNKQWGNFVVMTSDTEGSTKQGKYIRILGENLFEIESFSREEVIDVSKV
jgi:hypothetical protein